MPEISNRPVLRAGAWEVDWTEDGTERVAVFDTFEQAVEWIKANRLSVREQLEESLRGK